MSATGADLHAFIRHRFGMGDRLYAIVDAAREKDLVLAAKKMSGASPRWLFEDSASEQMSEVAPYLISLDFRGKYPYPGSDYLNLWTTTLGRSAGILLITPVAPGPLLDHLRGLFHVTDEEAHRYFFRFYDPRVLRVFLPACSAPEVTEFFGPIRMIFAETDNSAELMVFRPERTGLSQGVHPLSGPQGGPR